MASDQSIYKTLAGAGTLPFIASALIAFTGFEFPVSAAMLASSYGLAITSFLCGVHWATQLFRPGEVPFNLLITCNVFVVAVWLSFAFAPLTFALIVQIATFLGLLFIDYRLRELELIKPYYYSTRFAASAVALVSLLVVLSFPPA